ncbi:MAG TPA: hypothetical protein VGO24_03665, partial [Solirubrobacterales bacterium]|nr:hypothetical protein [Solirubrobacterales bacterium]
PKLFFTPSTRTAGGEGVEEDIRTTISGRGLPLTDLDHESDRLHRVLAWARKASNRRMHGDKAKLEVQLAVDGDAPADESDELTVNLRRELLELDVDAVDRRRAEEPPPGARGAESADLGTLLVTLGPTVLGSVVQTIRGWLSRGRGRSARLQLGDDVIELSGASPEQQEQLIAAFLARNANG